MLHDIVDTDTLLVSNIRNCNISIKDVYTNFASCIYSMLRYLYTSKDCIIVYNYSYSEFEFKIWYRGVYYLLNLFDILDGTFIPKISINDITICSTVRGMEDVKGIYRDGDYLVISLENYEVYLRDDCICDIIGGSLRRQYRLGLFKSRTVILKEIVIGGI